MVDGSAQAAERGGSQARRRIPALAALTALCVGLGSTGVALALPHEPEPSPAVCAPNDPNPEPGTQGDVPSGSVPNWDCGVRAVGFLAGANGPMAVAGTCAYTGGGLEDGTGVRVIDVSDPANPALATVLPTSSRELLAAQVAGERALLATRHIDTKAREGQVLGRDMLVDVWDIHTCTDPQLLGTVRLPTQSDVFGDGPGPLARLGGPAHNLKFNPSATRLYGSIPLQEIDLTNLADPSTWTVRTLRCTITEQHHLPHQAAPGLCDFIREDVNPFGTAEATPQIDHEPTFDPDGSRLYIGGQVPYPDSTAIWVLDMTGPDPVVLSVTQDAPGHAIDFLTIGAREYLLHSNEIAPASACVPEQVRPRFLGFGDRAFLLDITDETAPEPTSEILLADSQFEHCGPDNTGGPSIAYHAVDDPLDTTYVVIGFESAGFRFFDVRDPAEPVEVAYWNHGASEHTSPYIITETGQIWASDASGFWVLELEPHVRLQLGLDEVDPACHGRPESPNHDCPAPAGDVATSANPGSELAIGDSSSAELDEVSAAARSRTADVSGTPVSETSPLDTSAAAVLVVALGAVALGRLHTRRRRSA